MNEPAGLLAINAWVEGDESGARGLPAESIDDWAIRRRDTLRPHETLFAGAKPDLARWEEVGWGVILPDDDRDEVADRKAKARGDDAPAAIRRLLAARPGSNVYRYRPDLGSAYFRLYEPDGTPRPVSTAGGGIGAGEDRLPRYLLIVGSPREVPWRLQYVLNATHFVGRLDLPDEGLDRYVNALLDQWSGCPASRRKVVIWSVDHGRTDITADMRRILADPLRGLFERDGDVAARYLTGDEATYDALADALQDHPGLVVTTSHGATPVQAGPERLRAALGRPVDQRYAVLPPQRLAGWEPGGAIWYSHACCSAGADTHTLYDGIAKPGSKVDQVLRGVAAAGSCTAPLPGELLGRERPLRAFVGHVESTFNWTLRDRVTGEPKTSDLHDALYNGLFQQVGEPIGLALQRHYAQIGTLWSLWSSLNGALNRGEPEATQVALATRLAALDRQSLVILGDPTVTVPQD